MCRTVSRKPKIEAQADRFSAALLMPSELVASALKVTSGNDGRLQARDLYSARQVATTIIEAGDFTNVSNTAMVNRLIDLGYIHGVAHQSMGGAPNFKKNFNPVTYTVYRIRKALTRWLGALRKEKNND